MHEVQKIDGKIINPKLEANDRGQRGNPMADDATGHLLKLDYSGI
jgi:hypothetical protein